MSQEGTAAGRGGKLPDEIELAIMKLTLAERCVGVRLGAGLEYRSFRDKADVAQAVLERAIHNHIAAGRAALSSGEKET